MPPTLLRSNPLYTEEEEQEVVIIVDSLDDSTEGDAPEPPRVPRRAPSTSSGYGSNAGSHGRVSPTLPKSDQFPGPALTGQLCVGADKSDGSNTTSDSDSPVCTLSRSLKEDIRSCLGGCRWERDVGDVVEAAVRGAGGISAARARLHAALLALHDAPRVPNRGPSLPYCGPGVRPGDVTMMAKNTEMSLLDERSQDKTRHEVSRIRLSKNYIRESINSTRDRDKTLQEAASALFTLDGSRGEALSRRLARGEKRRRRCRAVLAVLAILLLLAAVGAVELLMSRGQRVFGAVLR